ncbi:arylsulfatase-like [Acanthaster planci]|uniref:Arylsulfatase-like n=1 Tax=Acanthaster planci TaxID=133434 RepID=A0A8B7Y0I4_ACAPL|nr:arylsulfatase-like [Acanthaster planci]
MVLNGVQYFQPVVSYVQGSKGVTWEGGVRVPSIAWWPGTIPADVTNHEVISSMDLFSLAVDLAGGSLPTDRIIDGRSIKEVLLHGGRSPHQALFHYCGKRIMAVRHGRYKMHYHTQEVLTDEALSALCRPRRVQNRMGTFHCGVCFGAYVTTHDPPLLFDLDEDPEEAYPLPVEEHAEIVYEVDHLVSEHQAGMAHGLPLFIDEYMGSPVIPCCNPPYCCCRAKYDSKNWF